MRAKTILNPPKRCSTAETGCLKGFLEGIYSRYTRRELISPDPLQFVYRFSDPADMEIAGFLAAALAYGRVGQIEKSLERLFGLIGARPAAFVRDFDRRKRGLLRDFRHRFTSGDDISDLLVLLKKVLFDCGGIEGYFVRGLDFSHENVVFALSEFCDSLILEHSRGNGGEVKSGLKYLLCSPERKSACKRLNLFLRWMVRDDAVDAGLWKSVPASKLLVPLDVHMSRISRDLGLWGGRKNVSIRTAVEVTTGFGRVCPEDPVRYDFALCRAGMVKDVSVGEELKLVRDGGFLSLK